MTVIERPYINVDRRELLYAVKGGQVYKSMGGCSMQMVRRGQNKRVDKRLRELTGAGWVELGPDGRFYQLTGQGETDLAARERQSAQTRGGTR